MNDTTARRWLDILAGSFKRERKAPKVYLRDSGLLHSLLGIRAPSALLTHPKVGASWEGFAMEQLLRLLPTRDIYHWATHQGAEVDLLAFVGGKRIGFEVKRTDRPTLTRSMVTAKDELELDALWVVYPGAVSATLGSGVRTLPLEAARRMLTDRGA